MILYIIGLIIFSFIIYQEKADIRRLEQTIKYLKEDDER
tara:strand:- start:453 stop:569 length:117 start_codon:yes stop_codon:yes gene_type:complete